MGRLQVVRVQYELALGSLADWLQAPLSLEGKGAVRRKSREPGGVLRGSTFLHLTPGLHWQEVAPARFNTPAMNCLHSIFPHPPHPVPHQGLGQTLLQARDSDIRCAGAGGRRSSNSEHRFHTAAHPIPFLAREGRKGRGSGTYCLAETEVGVSLLTKSMVEQVVRLPQPQREA